MTPIQAASLPLALAGKDLIAQAKTGSGKTAAFALALLANLNARRFAVQALVLCPTRELADQVTQEIRRLARAEDNIKVAHPLRRRRRCARSSPAWSTARTSWSARPAASSTTWGAAAWSWTRSTRWCSTKPTACSTWASPTTSPRSPRARRERQTLLFSATYPEGIADAGAPLHARAATRSSVRGAA